MHTSDENHKTLIQTAYPGAAKEASASESGGCVQFLKDGDRVELSACGSMHTRVELMVPPLFGCRRGYDCTMNAVSAVEKRPA